MFADKATIRRTGRLARHDRIRKKIDGTAARPRLSVRRSLSHIYAQIIDDVSGKSLIINVGKQKGVKVGDTIEITRAGRQILDPQTKKVLRTVVDTLGTAKITEVDDLSATAALNGSATVQVGDRVARVQ